MNVDETATQCFSLWTPRHILSSFRDHKQNLTDLSKQFLNICFNGIKHKQRSVYLSNGKMMQTLEAYDEWSPYLFTGNVGLHMKFKTIAGILAHIIKCIKSYEQNEEEMTKLNQKINSTIDKYKNLDDMLQWGMLVGIYVEIIFAFVYATAMS